MITIFASMKYFGYTKLVSRELLHMIRDLIQIEL